MKITSKQLRQIINEELERMMNEEGPETTITTGPTGTSVVGSSAPGDAIFSPKNAAFAVALKRSLQGSGTKPVVHDPDFSDKVGTAGYKKLFDDLMQGQTYSDSNADAGVTMTVNDMIATLAKSLGESRFPNFTKLVSEQMPTSPFSALLRRVQKLLGITADGIMGIETYFAILSGGAVDMDPGTFKKYREAAASLNNVLALSAAARSAYLNMIRDRLKAVGPVSIPDSRPVFGTLAGSEAPTKQ
jgi:hypothetical protein